MRIPPWLNAGVAQQTTPAFHPKQLAALGGVKQGGPFQPECVGRWQRCTCWLHQHI